MKKRQEIQVNREEILLRQWRERSSPDVDDDQRPESERVCAAARKK